MFRFAVIGSIYAAIAATIAIASAFVYYTITIPNPMALRQKEQAPVVRVLARDGTLLGVRGNPAPYVPIDLLPQHLIDAVVATEDRHFFEHWGIDPGGFLRAVFANLRAGHLVQGGSTISQQLAKNLFLGPQRTLRRKLEELVLALWLEARLGKRDILELYLNRVYFGGGAYGVEAAAQRYFGKSARKVSLTEAAVLAGLLKAPSRFSPVANPVLARTRAHSVLAKMAEAGFLSNDVAAQVSLLKVNFAPTLPQHEHSDVEYAIDAVLERLPSQVAANDREVIVETTFDANLQRHAQSIVQGLMAGAGRTADAGQAGLILMDTAGGIRALVGGRSYAESQFDRALKALRQPGSAFKMFVYLAAIESGLTPDSIVQDLPILGRGWSPRNDDGTYRGNVTLREALAHSINTVAARLNMSLGKGQTAAVAHRLGITSDLRDGPSLALGTSEVTLLELTSAYGVLASGGHSFTPHMIRTVRTSTGRVLYRWRAPRPLQLVAPAHVAEMNDMLSAVVASGTGRRAALPDRPVAGKTGTNQEFRDAWFVGYTAQYVGGVWVGNDDRRPMRRVTGGSLPARMWHDIMAVAHHGLPAVALAGSDRLAARPEQAAGQAVFADRDPVARMIERDQSRQTQRQGSLWELPALDGIWRSFGSGT
ncbi:MAG TPA: PBP1A family penicillin-binding protein [Hyphomicrobiaceae bacterium]|nr:PBP1A family penicillin-binding protein [Hyphomicrobiaceae bacterium]